MSGKIGEGFKKTQVLNIKDHGIFKWSKKRKTESALTMRRSLVTLEKPVSVELWD